MQPPDTMETTMDDRTGYTQTSIHQALQNDYLALAAVAWRMAGHLENIVIILGHPRMEGREHEEMDRGQRWALEALSAYNALMKGR